MCKLVLVNPKYIILIFTKANALFQHALLLKVIGKGYWYDTFHCFKTKVLTENNIIVSTYTYMHAYINK